MKFNPVQPSRREPVRYKLWVVYFLMFVLPAAYLLYVISQFVDGGPLSDSQLTQTKVVVLIGLPATLIMSAGAFLLLERSLGNVKRLLTFVETFLNEFKSAAISPPPSGDEVEQVTHYVQGMISEFQRRMSEVDSRAQALQATNVRLTDHALIDEQTGLYNRKHGMRMLDVEIQRAGRNGNPLSIIRADICDLNAFRNRHGNAVADSAIDAIGKHLASRVRRVDVVAYLTEGQFLILLLETARAGAEIVAGRMMTSTEELHVPGTEGPGAGLSITVGIGSLEGDSDGAQRMLERAQADLRNKGPS